MRPKWNGNKIRLLRTIEYQMSQPEFAKKLGISDRTLGKLERDEILINEHYSNALDSLNGKTIWIELEREEMSILIKLIDYLDYFLDKIYPKSHDIFYEIDQVRSILIDSLE